MESNRSRRSTWPRRLLAVGDDPQNAQYLHRLAAELQHAAGQPGSGRVYGRMTADLELRSQTLTYVGWQHGEQVVQGGVGLRHLALRAGPDDLLDPLKIAPGGLPPEQVKKVLAARRMRRDDDGVRAERKFRMRFVVDFQCASDQAVSPEVFVVEQPRRLRDPVKPHAPSVGRREEEAAIPPLDGAPVDQPDQSGMTQSVMLQVPRVPTTAPVPRRLRTRAPPTPSGLGDRSNSLRLVDVFRVDPRRIRNPRRSRWRRLRRPGAVGGRFRLRLLGGR